MYLLVNICGLFGLIGFVKLGFLAALNAEVSLSNIVLSTRF